MTFYNIIFGILFMGACKELLDLLNKNCQTIWIAATIAVIIFNDAVNTSEILESRSSVSYSTLMKLIDLISFVLLSLSLIALDPKENLFDVVVDLENNLHFLKPPWVLWVLLLTYWLFLILWNYLAGCFSSRTFPDWLKVCSVALLLPFFLGFIVSFCGYATLEEVPRWPAWFTFGSIVLYFFILKPIYRSEVSR